MLIVSILDFQKNQIQNASFHTLTSPPSSPATGQYYFNTANKTLSVFDGTQWLNYGTASISTSAPLVATPGAGGVVTISIPAATSSQAGHMTTEFAALLENATSSNTANTLVRRDSSGNMSVGTINAAKVTGLSAPTAGNDAATKDYVDAMAQGLATKQPVRVATTANLSLSSVSVVDGVTLANGDRVLVKNQTTASENGIYVKNGAGLTRADDFNTSAEAIPSSYCLVQEGTTNQESGWVLSTNSPITLGTTALTFVKFSQAGIIDAGLAMEKVGSQLNVRSDGATIVINGTNQLEVGLVPVAKGGTGATTPASARTNLGAVGTYGTAISGASTYNITHNLNTNSPAVTIYNSDGVQVLARVTVVNANQITVQFSSNFTGSIRVVG